MVDVRSTTTAAAEVFDDGGMITASLSVAIMTKAPTGTWAVNSAPLVAASPK